MIGDGGRLCRPNFDHGEKTMQNMNYCKFQNTLAALTECYKSPDFWRELESAEEHSARRGLFELCILIAGELSEEDLI